MLVLVLLGLLPRAVGVRSPPGIPIIHNWIPLSRPCRREISGFLCGGRILRLPVFSCLSVPLVSAATPHLAQRFRSIINASPFVNTLFGNWSTNLKIGRPGRAWVHPTFWGGLHLLLRPGRPPKAVRRCDALQTGRRTGNKKRARSSSRRVLRC